ncbi:sibling bacteriocin [Paenibacillus terrae HPL-003]|uniref:Sibling bacteriocin n=1 Tax=Paenibacillus terrae (strain HPL-003) TaxID=985665 RepID=G7VYJ8_PAETH|nr:ClbS/DfsB family four-helix bundle protein [Paenibacillus terrae]AET58526.1 sibling bacteriocin [Paenibacillus terrae HPL-003]
MPSYHYASKAELKEAIHASYLLLDGEYKEVDENQKDIRISEVDKTPTEIIAYQLGWLHLVMSWDRDEKEGKDVIMPAPNYKWTGSNPKWPMARWIHINSVAPFKTFRAKIRKWKKYNALH